jgi:hypothetical protein
LSNERIDPETLAAFLDGTLSASDRERLLRAAAQGGAVYEQLIEAQALLYDGVAGTEAIAPRVSVTAAPPAANRSPGEDPWWMRHAWKLGAILVAAGIAGIIFKRRADLPNASPNASLTAGTVQHVMALAAGANPDSAFGVGWDRIDWSITRGRTQSVDDGVYAFRLGVRFVDLAVASSSNDTSARHALGQTLVALASGAETGSPVAARIEALAAADQRPTVEEMSSICEDLRTLVNHPAAYDAAVWTESARAGARAKQATFFAPGGRPMRELKRIIAKLEELPPPGPGPTAEVLQALKQVDEQSRTSPADVSAIASMLDSTVARGGRLAP